MKRIAFFLLVSFLTSCESKVSYTKPDNLIPKDKMVDLLYDMHLAIGTSNVTNKNLEKNRNYLSLVYEKYGVDSVQFAMSNTYYTSNINDYEDIFKEVHKRLEVLHESYKTERDSLIEASKGLRQE
jgi:hypothetical protein